MSKNHWVIDYETLVDCTVLVAEHYTGEEVKVFSVCKLHNQFSELLNFLEQNKKQDEWHISFNGLSFDSQISEHILKASSYLKNLSGEAIANWVYKKAQDIIERQNENKFAEFSERDLSIRQIDVFKLNHWDNAAKRSSLKWIQYSMDWINLLDMPIRHNQSITTQTQLDTIIEYCKNDVKSTKRIMHLSKEQINLRKTLTQEYGINLFSASEPRISKELFMYFLSEETGISKYELKNLRTKRDLIKISDIILPYTNFKSLTFKSLLDNFKSLILDARYTKG